ncbi:MAG TPA: hypothetical protein VMB50_10810 [Myxococcales bacterium]|nr:hypothetical protein [Myxococcales bacterium]
MSPDDLAFATLAANPVGGLLIAIPFGMLKLHYPAWLAVTAGVPLAYLQVPAVDVLWSTLERAGWWRRFLERRRSARVERLLASRGGFWITFAAAPFLGPWLVMAFMRYAQVPQRKVALPIVLALAATAAVVAAICLVVPDLFHLKG